MDEFLTRLKIRCSDWSIFCQESSQNLNSRQNHRVYVGFAISKLVHSTSHFQFRPSTPLLDHNAYRTDTDDETAASSPSAVLGNGGCR